MNREADSEERAAGETAPSPHDSDTCPSGVPPNTFPGYWIIGGISSGGQSVVYKAIQKATKRKVAIKVIKEGPFANAKERARFDREIQVLGQLSHPNVVSIHETGVSGGCQYFVMDYISGQSLDAYVAKAGLPIKDTLRLFVKICDAVNTAHLHGIIHRDLKPSNIRIDANGEPHILDFGLAKVAISESDSSMVTMTGQFIGSVPWASPEQAEAIPAKVDLRTDVYSLGVILYQLLTGRFPYEVVGNVRDVLDRILKSEPVRPSTSRNQIDDEVDTIVVKCLAKERVRRYQTAGELGRDIERYLRGEAIEAKRDSAGYILRKHLARHRLPLAVGAVFAVLVVASLVATFALWRRAEKQRQVSDAVLEFLDEDIFSAMRAQRDTILTLENVVDRASTGLSSRFVEAPLAEAEIRKRVALIYLSSLWAPEKAVPHFERALEIRRSEYGEYDLGVSYGMCDLAVALWRMGDRERAIEMFRGAVDAQRSAHPGDHQDVARVMLRAARGMEITYYRDEGEKLCRESLAMFRRIHAEDNRAVTDALRLLSRYIGGSLAELEEVERELVERLEEEGDSHYRYGGDLSSLAGTLWLRGKYAEAESLCMEAIQHLRVADGESDFDILYWTWEVGRIYELQGRYGDAEKKYREALALARATAAKEPRVKRAGENLYLKHLADVLAIQGKHNEADSINALLLESALAEVRLMEEKLDPSNHKLIEAKLGVAILYERGGHDHEAEYLRREALDSMQGLRGWELQAKGAALDGLADLYERQGRYGEAETVRLEALSLLVELGGIGLGGVSPRYEIERLEHLYEMWGRPERLVPMAEQSARDMLALGGGDPMSLNAVAWMIARERSLGAASYAMALETAEKANELSPDNWAYLNTMGVAQYRNGLYGRAVDTLGRSERMAADDPYNVAFISMALFKVGREEEARAELERLEELMKAPLNTENGELQAFLAEARDLAASRE
jgi:tRNA A-37 threonylcarbamoyl transferase component Bud32